MKQNATDRTPARRSQRYAPPSQYEASVEQLPGDKPYRKPNKFVELLCWAVILSLIVGVVSLPFFEDDMMADAPSNEHVPVEDSVAMAKMFLFVRQVAPEESSVKDLDGMEHGSVQHRLVRTAMVAEADSLDKAFDTVELLERKIEKDEYEPTELQSQLIDDTRRVLEKRQEQGDRFDPTSIPAERRERLEKELGWAGSLLLSPRESTDTSKRQQVLSSATTTSTLLMIGVFAFLAFVFGGLLMSVVAGLMYWRGQLRIGVADQSGSGTIYLETFTFWMLAYFGTSILLTLALWASGVKVDAEQSGNGDITGLLFTAALFGGSLITLVWPLIRGVGFSKLCDDIGWKFQNPFVEGFKGLLGYAAGVVVLGIGLFATLFLTVFSTMMSAKSPELAGDNVVAHPVQEWIGSGQFALIAFSFLLACVFAPIVEETMFRGVFFRYLRDRTGGMPRWGSVLVTAFVNAFVFAVIHPQGWIAVPVLMSFAVVLTLIRQWRGSLIAPMLVHCFHNSVLLIITFVVMVG
ncbi:MAG: type II CAAX endopeptidase family protein [Pirellulaceae bacterium]